MATEILEINDLLREGLQRRVALDQHAIEDYRDAMSHKAKFPPVIVFCDGEHFYLADGFHRVEAALQLGAKKIKADVSPGSYADALRYSFKANQTHGVRLTNEDKRQSVRDAWEHRRELFDLGDGVDPSVPVIADFCGVSEPTVRLILKDLQPLKVLGVDRTATDTETDAGDVPQPPVRRVAGKDGKTREIRQPTPPVRIPPPTQRPCRNGYYIGPDGKEHAIGIILDRFNVEIPPRLNNAFTNDAEKVNDWIARCREFKAEVEGAAKAGFTIGIPQRAVINLDAAYHELKAALPFCVCRMCQGNGCAACSERGYQTKDQYERNPKEFKA